ncbi:MAG TPA: hypothetical protein VHP36_05425 [Chitinispirillaceae bacterium]|nr:hypothetical protein [Chitinispirillaceae bacterium]
MAIKKAGTDHSLLLSNFEVWATGDNWHGQLGLGHNNNCNLFTKTVYGNTTAIASGGCHSMLVSWGNVWATGNNRQGELGLGHKIDQNSFVKCP